MPYDDNPDFGQDFDPYAKKDEQDQLSQRLSALEQNLAQAAQQISPHLQFVENIAASGARQLARQKALSEAARQIPQLKEFVGSEAYNEVLSTRRKLKEAITNAETYFEYQRDLPELYGIAWQIGQARASQQWTQSPGETRPGQSGQGPPDLSTSEKRRQYIATLESRGIKDVDLDRADPQHGRLDR